MSESQRERAVNFSTFQQLTPNSNPRIRAFYEKLRKAGKRDKVALTAYMRKLVTILNAMLKTQAAWESECLA